MLQTRTGWRGTCVLAFVLGILLGSRSPGFADEGRAKKIDLRAGSVYLSNISVPY